jgi:hypothetical protein
MYDKENNYKSCGSRSFSSTKQSFSFSSTNKLFFFLGQRRSGPSKKNEKGHIVEKGILELCEDLEISLRWGHLRCKFTICYG